MKKGECGSCGYEAELEKCPRWRRTDGAEATDEVWLCKVCRNSPAGNAAMYPMNYPPDVATVLQMMAACTNMILDEIRTKGIKEAHLK